MTSYTKARALLVTAGVFKGEPAQPADTGCFQDGSQWRIEVPTVNSATAAQTLLEGAAAKGITINRITETLGMFCHPDADIERYVRLGREHGVQVLMSIGPRATYDIGASVRTPEGARNGNRLRGQDQLEKALADLLRGLELGVRGFVIYDEGLLRVLGTLRSLGELPAQVHLKVSAHCGHGNPASMQLLSNLGADSINPVRDLPIPAIASLRQAVTVPLDIHVDNPKSSGGFIRTLDVPDIVTAAAPVYLKTGNGVMDGHGTRPTPEQVTGMLRQAQIVTETMKRYCPHLQQSTTLPTATVGVV
ncbi:hypothetical protein ACQP2U_42920 (plasmid) [Nocardia sp. CA-084685]|uniref:hypothetical protein n=1 Tax=Nocardia sp. CA-084685 TaxID=3239970 RepID=UPI003D98A63C